jgi:zinc/manganese transport system substrate-binding protein
LHREIKAAFASIPKERRKIITSHDAFSYFGDAYDVVFVAPQGVSSIAEPSARDVARIIQQIREERIRAIFLENALPQRLARQISSETGVKIAGKLYADVLGDNILTYAQMMRHNYKAILTALR